MDIDNDTIPAPLHNPPHNPEIVCVKVVEVRPFDMIDEVRSVCEIQHPSGKAVVGQLSGVCLDADGQCCLSPEWSDISEVYLARDVTVIRGMSPPITDCRDLPGCQR